MSFILLKELKMSLANLTLQGMDRYGAIELRQNADRFVVRGFLLSVSVTAFIFLIYFNIPSNIQDKVIGPIKRSFADIAPPPSMKQNIIEAIALSAPLVDPARPTFGIPVPVPNAVAPEIFMPNINEPISSPITSVIRGTTPGSTVITIPVEPVVQPIVDEDDPEVFKSVDKDPEPTVPISSLIEYPEIAKRSGLEGKVLISALIDVDGTVIRTRIEKADYEVFKQAAIDAITKVRFTPALIGEEPVRLWYTVPISFKLTSQ
jgi:periplasmic protein TonB